MGPTDPPAVAGTGPRTRAAAVLLGLLAVVAAAAGAVLSPRATTLLADPGTLVRWGLPAVEGVHDLALAVTVGALVLAVLALPAGGPAAARATQVATGAGVLWTLGAVGVLVLTYGSVSGTAPADPAFGAELGGFLTGFELGRSLLLTVVLAAAATTVAAAATGPRSTLLATGLALAALLPIALTGHSGSAEGHETAVTAMGLHLVGIAVWVGGLVTLVLLRPVLRGEALATVVSRFSGLALASVVVVSVSGVLNASTRLDGLADLGSRYGLLVLAKTALVAVLVAAGWWHRRSLLPALAAGRPVSGAWSSASWSSWRSPSGWPSACPGRRRPSPTARPRTRGRPPRCSSARPCRPSRPSAGCSRCGARTCCGSSSPPGWPSRTCSACDGCTGAATAGRCGGRCSGSRGWPSSSSSPAPGWPPTAGSSSAPTCSST